MKKILPLLLIFASFAANAQQINKSLKAANGRLIGFLEYKPTDYQAANKTLKYPLIIFLHGIGERGNGTTELYKVANNGIPKNIKAGHKMKFTWNGKTETFLVLSPQLAADYSSWQAYYVEEMIKYAKSNLNIDTNRIILTGLSLGGGGVWRYPATSLENAKTLAAIGISCGVKHTLTYKNITDAKLPTWAFHATDDPTVSVSSTNSIIQTLNSYNPVVQPYKTIWPTGGHSIWTRVFDTTYKYQNPNIYEWFLAQNKSYAVNKRPTPIVSNITASLNPGTATLDASRSTDADGTIQRVIWRQVSGPATTTLTNAVSIDGICKVSGATIKGTYEYEVKVVDNRADYKLDTISLTISDAVAANKLPVSVAGTSQAITLPTSSITLDGRSSSDPDGSITNYAWSQSEGPSTATIANASAASTTASGLQQGVYKFRLRVTDNANATSDSYKTVTVNAQQQSTNILPTAKAGNDDILYTPASSVTFDGSASYDNDGKIARYKWEKLSGPTNGTIQSASSATTSVINLVEGSYKFRLTVYDDRGDSAIDNRYVTVKPGSTNVSPTARAGENDVIYAPVSSVTFDGSASSDKDGKIVSYKWEKLQGPSSFTIQSPTSAVTTITNLVVGSYKFRLTVYDDRGASAMDNHYVTVNAASSATTSVPPTVNAGDDQVIISAANSANLSATSDDDYSISSYLWSQLEGPSTATFSSKSSKNTSVGELKLGRYKFNVKVTNNSGLSTSDQVYVTVKARPIAKVTEDKTITGTSTSISGSGSIDPDGTIAKYEWFQQSGPSTANISTPAGINTTVSSLIKGTYFFVLRVRDNEGYTDTEGVYIYVTGTSAVATLSNEVSTEASFSKEKPETATTTTQIAAAPNPVRSTTNITISNKATGLTYFNVYDMNGILIKRIASNKTTEVLTQPVDLTGLTAGTYQIQAQINNTTNLVTRVIKL